MTDQGKQVYGIDFSGALDAGNRIWIARGVPEDAWLQVSECCRARDLPNSTRRLESCLPALVNLIKSNRNAVFGLDFPFGLPISLVKEHAWDEFIMTFPSSFPNPDDFKKKCFSKAGNQELRRRTDCEAHTPLSPYNLRLYKQTYYGISKVLFPLILDSSARVLPFHKPSAGKPALLEICPASTLRILGLYGIPYKGRGGTRRNNRRDILETMERKCPIAVKHAEIRHKIMEDKGGDALDSVIAAMATFNAIRNVDGLIPHDNGNWKTEGYVYA